MFTVGQKVVCVNVAHLRAGTELQLNAVYTVTALCPAGPSGIAGIQIAEIIAPSTLIDPRKGWLVTRFRPIVERKTDISIFTAMLTNEKIPALTRARKAAEAL